MPIARDSSSDIKKSMKAILKVEKDDTILYNFASKEFHKSGKNKPGSCWFNRYEVIDKNTLRIKYQYGGGDLEMDDWWDVKID